MTMRWTACVAAAVLAIGILPLRAEQTPPATATETIFAVTIRTGPAWDAAKPPNEQRFFAEHSQNIRRMQADGQLVIGGRFSDLGLLLVKAADEAAVGGLLARDPSIKEGVFTADVHRWAGFAWGCLEKPPARAAADRAPGSR